MTAIDIINSMRNSELVNYYKYCMVHRFYELRHSGCCYHPNYNSCRVYAGENKIYNLHWNNEMFLLNEMWDRYLNSSNFTESCWWEAQNIFQTKIQ